MILPKGLDAVVAAVPDLKKLDKATKALEADLFKRFLKEASPKGGMFGGSSATPGSDIYGDMSRDALADSLADKGTLGVGRVIFRQMAPAVIRQHHADSASTSSDSPRS